MKTISFFTIISLIVFLASCEKSDPIEQQTGTVRLNLNPDWKGLDVDIQEKGITKSAAELGKTDLYCWTWSRENYQLVKGFPQKQSGINGKVYQYDLPKINQYIVFTNINQEDSTDFILSTDGSSLYHTLKDKNYSDTELVCGGIPNLDASTGQISIDAKAELIRSMAKIEILLKIKDNQNNSIENAQNFIKRIWFNMEGNFFKRQRCYIGNTGNGESVFSHYNESDYHIFNIKKDALAFSDLTVIQDEKFETMYEIFSGYVFSNGTNPNVTIEFEFTDTSMPIRINWYNIGYITTGVINQIILEVKESDLK